MVNQAGTFGPWELGNGMHEERILPQAAFHVREQLQGGEATTRTLATSHPQLGNVVSGFKPLSAGDGTYSALYPFGWTSYKPFATDVSMRFWSPIVAREDERTSMPVAFFDVRLANPTRPPGHRLGDVSRSPTRRRTWAPRRRARARG